MICPSHNKKQEFLFLKRQTKSSPIHSLCHFFVQAVPCVKEYLSPGTLSPVSPMNLTHSFPSFLPGTRSSTDPSSLKQAPSCWRITFLPLENLLKAVCTQTEIIVSKHFPHLLKCKCPLLMFIPPA